MKRKVDENSDDTTSQEKKKRRIEGSMDLVLPDLPVEIWQTILGTDIPLGENDMKIALKEQRQLRLASKSINAMIVKIWHSISSSMWPQFYQKHMKDMPNEKFVPFYTKMKIFSCTYVSCSDEKPKFKSVKCPVCKTKLKNFTPENEDIFVSCEHCTKNYGTELKWKLYYSIYECKVCKKETPFQAFECEACNESFCWSCAEEVQYLGPVDGNYARKYCKECVEECDHCDGEMGTTEGECYRCKLPQCEVCETYQECENSIEESGDNSDRSGSDEEPSD